MASIPERMGKPTQSGGPCESILVLKRGADVMVNHFYPWALLLLSDASLFHEIVLQVFEDSCCYQAFSSPC